LFTPFGTGYFSIMMPGHSGGANLFSTSADPETGTAYVISIAMPALERYFSSPAEAAKYLGSGNYGPTLGTINSGRRSAAGRAAGAETPAPRAGGAGAGGRRGAAPGGEAATIQRGQAIYQQTCQACHGANLVAADGAAPPLVGIVDRLSEEEVRAVIHDGRARMPSFAAMPDADLTAIVTFLQSPAATQGGPAGGAGARGGGIPDYPPNVEVPPRQFSAYSAMPAFITPPYSSITAYDLNRGTIKWQVPDGEAIGVDPPGNNFGIMKDHGPKARLAVTAGGLAFQATIEKKIRAYDKDTGKVLWTFPLPDGSEGSPAIYDVDGREYIAVFTRGAYLAFALPAGTK
jgi:quinoprotein glucose dehydrogenase